MNHHNTLLYFVLILFFHRVAGASPADFVTMYDSCVRHGVSESVPGCAEPTGFFVLSTTQNSITVRWDSGGDGTAGFELGESKKSVKGIQPQSKPFFVSGSNTYAFLGLNPNTEYYLYIRRVCIISPGQYQYSDWVRIGAKTTAILISDCGYDSTKISIGAVTFNSFRLNLSPYRYLSAEGRRLLVRYRLVSIPPHLPSSPALGRWDEVLLYKSENMKISNLFSGGTYEIYCNEILDGKFMEYTKACTEVGPFYITLNDYNDFCGYSTETTLQCVGSDYISLKFEGPALGYDSLRYVVGLKPIADSSSAWVFYYHFQGSDFTIHNLSENTNYEVVVYLLVGKSGFNYDYICSASQYLTFTTFARENSSDDDGDGIPDHCDTDNTDGPSGDSDNDGIPNDEDNGTPVNPYPQLPALACGSAVPVQPYDPTDLLDAANIGDVFYINNFPILITQVTGGAGTYSGAGIIGLPFNSKYLNVTFSYIKVSKSYVVIDGLVYGISNPDIPYMALDTAFYGEDRFCKHAPDNEGFNESGIWPTTNSEYNPLGFDQNGQYQMPPFQGWEPGDPFDPNLDPNGFDSNGIHFQTQTSFNESGCNQAGFTIDGQICDPGLNGPYYWLESGNTTEGISYSNEVKDTIRPLVLNIIDSLIQLYSDSIFYIKNSCDTLRDSMRQYFSNLGYSNVDDRKFIFGPNDEWFKEGMSKKFITAPQKLGIATDRDPNEALLENTHIELYYCDLKLNEYIDIVHILEELRTDPLLADFVEDLCKKIKKFSSEEVEYYKNITNFKSWIFSNVNSFVTEELYLFESFGQSKRLDELHKKNTPFDIKRVDFPGDNLNDPQMAINVFDSEIMLANNNLIDYNYNIVFNTRSGNEKKFSEVERAFYLESMCRFNKSLSGGDDSDGFLPVQISKDVMGRTYTLYLDSIVFSPAGGLANIYTIINTTPSPDRIVLRSAGVPFGPSGFTGNTKLFLGQNVSIALSNTIKMNIFENNNTYIDFDCDGLRSINIDGEIEFCRNYIVPLEPVSLAPMPEPNNVKAHFIVSMPSWGEFVTNLTIQPFAIPEFDSIKWQASNVVFDFSNSFTPAEIKFPEYYNSPFTQKHNNVIIASGLWKGFYIGSLSVTLPKKFGKQTGEMLTVGVSNVIFDDTGLSGEIFAAPILDICSGNIGGWAFSIDTFALKFSRNGLIGSKMNGLLNLPIFSKGNSDCAIIDDCIKYETLILPGNQYIFAVKPLTEYTADVWKAKVTLLPSSEIEIKYIGGSIHAKAVLNGKITIDGDLNNNFNVKIPDLAFENLVLRNKSPYFEPGIWDVPEAELGIEFAGFGLLIDSIKMMKVPNSEKEARLKFRTLIMLSDNGVGNFTANGGFQLKGRLVDIGNRQRWIYDGFNVDNVCIDASFPGVNYLKGCLTFFGQDSPHPSFGRGFKGQVEVDFQGIDVNIMALGVFGNMGSYKYFMVDALAEFNPGIGNGALQLIGFGGGAAYHMDRIGDTDTGLPDNIPNTDPSTVSLGSSLSNLVYVPNVTKGLSVHATVVIALAKKEAFNLNATFGISFYSAGGIDEAFFKGTAKVMDEVTFSAAPKFQGDGPPEVDAQICAYVYMTYGFSEKQFHGLFKVYVDVVDVLHGSGTAEILIKPGYWFINIGTPDKPISLTFSIPGININLAKVGFYFDIGKNIPAFPGLPSNVKSLTGLGNIVSSESLRRTGNGFATGVRFDASTGHLKYLIFYAQFDLGLGFDMMLQDYGDAICVNNGNEKLGINGWYASGQMWAYVNGDIGINVKLWGKDRQFSILKMSVAAALQAKFPNPFFGRGVVSGNYKILGGLVKGTCKFEIKVGQECQMEGGADPNLNREIIVDMVPIDSSENINTMTTPRATFSIPLNQALSDGTDVWEVKLISSAIIKDGIILPDVESIFDGNTALEVKTDNVLPSEQWLKFVVKVEVIKNGAHFSFEEKKVIFKTGQSPDYIPDDNVLFSYPINTQYNFYKDEHPYRKGCVKLKFGMPNLFQNNVPANSHVVRLTPIDSGGSDFESPFLYDSPNNIIEFSMPAALQTGTVYSLKIVKKASSSPSYSQDGMDVNENYSDSDGEMDKILYAMHFRTSTYATFSEKIDYIKNNVNVFSTNEWLKGQYAINEPLDFFEIHGGKLDPVVSASLDLTENTWFLPQRPKFKLAYNYYYGYNYVPSSCEVDLFVNTKNLFDQLKLDQMPVGFEEEFGNPEVRLSLDGTLPVLNPITNQTLDLTTVNEFHDVWDYYKDKLISFKTWKCAGQTQWSAFPQNCNSPCCSIGQGGDCCNDACVFGIHNVLLSSMINSNMPVPQSGTKFKVSIKYAIPGYGTTTAKTIEIVKP